jgi:AraC-like DNA-binding protein
MADRHSNAARSPAPATHVHASGNGWLLTEYVCMAGPDDAPFEEARDGFTMAAVRAGTFRYKADTGEAILHPGALLLGNDRACYACGHEHSRGDRCLAINIGPDLFAELAATAAGTSRFRFPQPMHPACPRVQTRFAALLDSVAGHDRIEIETRLLHLVEQVLADASASSPRPSRVSAQDEKRMARALQHIERHFTQPLDLDGLSAIAGMSKYHFLRTFRRVAGQPPHQYLLGLRMAHVAERLTREPGSVSQLAFASGFGDLSTFNARFKRHFGESPTAWRRRYGR